MNFVPRSLTLLVKLGGASVSQLTGAMKPRAMLQIQLRHSQRLLASAMKRLLTPIGETDR